MTREEKYLEWVRKYQMHETLIECLRSATDTATSSSSIAAARTLLFIARELAAIHDTLKNVSPEKKDNDNQNAG